MGTRQHNPEEIVAKLRQADVLVSQGYSVTEAIRGIGQVRRTEDVEVENQRLRKSIAGLTLDKLILQEAAWGRHLEPRAPTCECRAHRPVDIDIRAPGLPCTRSAPLDTAQGGAEQRR